MTSRRFALLALGAVACSHALDHPVGPHDLDVSATVSAVTLAYNCTSSPPSSGACAADTNCNPPCEQSNMTLELVAAPGNGPVPVEIDAVRAVYANGDTAFTLASSNPTQWSDGAYVPWDQSLAAGTTLEVEYDLLEQSAFSSSLRKSSDTAGQFGSMYRFEVDIRIDGALRTIALDNVTQEPPANT